MAQAYTPGLKVAAVARHRCRRLLPIAGEVIVAQGDRVAARQVVARTFMPGVVTPLNLANQLSLPPGEVPACMLKKEGDEVAVGDVLARTKGMFGFFQTEYTAKVAGRVESISSTTGQVILRGPAQPLELLAYLAGEVMEVIPGEGAAIEADVSLIQGIFGVGGEAFGPVRLAGDSPSEPLTPDLIRPDMQGAVVVGGGRVTGEALNEAIRIGASAVVTGGIDDSDLKELLGYDLGVAVTGSEQIGLTLVLTEGFGDIAMAERTWRLLESRQGDEAAVNGTTQIRAGVMRPEIVIPLAADHKPEDAKASSAGAALEVGTPVRVIRDPNFGRIGRVAALPPEPRVLASGSKARVLEVELPSGERITTARANVELIEE